MKKIAIACITFLVAVIILTSLSFNIKTVEAANGDGYSIDHVSRTIEILHNGYVFINDTIRIVGNATVGETLGNFRIGFPYKYGTQLLQCVAYDASDIFNVTLNVPLESRMGFYAVEIGFPQPLDISTGTAHIFTVGFVLSNNLLTASSTNQYTLDFPAYPSLTKPATSCNATLFFPDNVTAITITKNDETVNSSAYGIVPLPAFTASPATTDFTLSSDKLRVFDVKELNREIAVNEAGEMGGSDSYYITSKEPQTITAIEIILPDNASNISAHDQFGRTFEQAPTPVENEEINRYRIAFSLPLESYKSTRFSVEYSLSDSYSRMQEGTNKFNITFPLFPQMDYYIESASIAVTLPEGARILNQESILIDNAYSVTKNIFQETVTIELQDVSFAKDLSSSENVLQITYEYNPLWLSFRPTLWVWALAVIGCAITVVWRRPKAPSTAAIPTMTVKLRPEDIKSFTDSYEDKRKIISEMDSLEIMAQKGKIPRRRYKVRRKTLEIRLDTLSRNLAEYKEKMCSAGGKYADLMRQLEIAETEINEVETNMKSIEARHSRGEISLEAYRKLLADYQHRKETANTTISGILLRLREELR